MRILMLGWEFPPYISGGLGTACRGLTDAMRRLQTRILFVLPRAIDSQEQTGPDEEYKSQGGSHRTRLMSDKFRQSSGEMSVAPVQCELTNPYHTAPPGPMNMSG
ncbi:MAG: glycogen/starch synthase, partial [Candidatus Latescibacterota bacterium]